MKLSLYEQEVTINVVRGENYAEVYCSDPTWIRKMDKLVTKNPDAFKIIREDSVSKPIGFLKNLITVRSPISMTDERRKAASERLKKYWEERRGSVE